MNFEDPQSRSPHAKAHHFLDPTPDFDLQPFSTEGFRQIQGKIPFSLAAHHSVKTAFEIDPPDFGNEINDLAFPILRAGRVLNPGTVLKSGTCRRIRLRTPRGEGQNKEGDNK